MKLRIRNLSKTYSNGVQALKNVNLEISKGMFGLLGPNGAGKSTLMRTLAGLQAPDTGSLSIADIDMLKQKLTLRAMLGYLPQEFGVYPKVSAVSLLTHLAMLKGIMNPSERRAVVNALLHKTNLYAHRKKRLSTYSGGMKQRFGIAQALLANPKLIIVDEPTAGLDPAERNRFLNLLSELGEDTIVILSTHIVEDVKELCTDMAIINKGKVLLKTDPQEAVASMVGKIWEKTIAKQDLPRYKEAYQVISARMYGGKPIIRVYSDQMPNEDFVSAQADLEDVYFTQIAADLSSSN